MLINLTELFKNKNFPRLNNFRVKILETKERSTIVLIKGHKVEIPYVLDKNKNYTISFDNDKQQYRIIEVKSLNTFLKERIGSFVEEFLNLSKLDRLDFNLYFNNLSNNERVDDKERENNFVFKNNKKDFFFIFNTFFLKIKASIFLKISEDRRVSFLLYLKEKLDDKESIVNDIKEELSDIKFEKIMIFDNDKVNYINEISNIFQNKGIDIII